MKEIRYRDNLYPPDWHDISKAIRARAAGHCEWCGAAAGERHPITGALVVLTVHHIGVPYPDGTPGDPGDKFDNRPENLIALCQKCHLDADRGPSVKKAAATRARKKHESIKRSGQLGLL